MKRSIKTLLVFYFTFSSSLLDAQLEAQKWYFGNQAGLDFATNPPTVLTNGVINTSEGCASISDALGNLLFYTDGINVYNSTHALMANGTGLMGNGSTTQSGIIVKQPGNTSIYYVFTQDDIAGPDGFRYSTVDMSLAAGLGSVTVKNFSLFTPSCEKITAVKHCNGIDTWVISHDWNSNNFRTFLVNATGVSTAPVISSVGAVVTSTGTVAYNTLGQMKISPNGRKLGLAIYNPSLAAPFEIYDFDPSTGLVSNPLVLGNDFPNYGCEFSPDGTKFYGAKYGAQIYQWDLCAGSNSAIIASQTNIVTGTVSGTFGSLQLAIDGKIYIAKSGQTLSVIHNPNALGAACNFSFNGISIAPKSAALGLPNFINSFFKTPASAFTNTVACNTVSFTAPNNTVNSGCTASSFSTTGIQWDFGHLASGTANSSTLNNPVHIYNGPGTYTVKLIIYNQCSTDTVTQQVIILNASPNLNVAGTFTICKGDKRTYTVSGASSYTWSGNVITSTIALSPTVSTAYTVSGTNTLNTCSSLKTFSISVNKCLGFYDEALSGEMNLFPNPFKDVLKIEVFKNTEVLIMNQNGLLIYEKKFDEDGEYIINTEAFPSGVYLISLSTKNETKRLRFVKLE